MSQATSSSHKGPAHLIWVQSHDERAALQELLVLRILPHAGRKSSLNLRRHAQSLVVGLRCQRPLQTVTPMQGCTLLGSRRLRGTKLAHVKRGQHMRLRLYTAIGWPTALCTCAAVLPRCCSAGVCRAGAGLGLRHSAGRMLITPCLLLLSCTARFRSPDCSLDSLILLLLQIHACMLPPSCVAGQQSPLTPCQARLWRPGINHGGPDAVQHLQAESQLAPAPSNIQHTCMPACTASVPLQLVEHSR